MNPITFTIVTVTYNAASCVERTMQSVLAQTYPHVEYLVIDGGSSDGTPDVIRRYASRLTNWISEPDRGIYDAMNKGIRMATGDYLLFLNADDTLSGPDVLQRVADALADEAASMPDVVYGSWRVETSYGVYHREPGDIMRLRSQWVISHQATFVRVSLLKQRPFDLQYRLCADYDMLSDFMMQGRRFLRVGVEIAGGPVDSGASFRNFAASKREHYRISRRHGCGNRLATEWVIARVAVVHALRCCLPKAWSEAFFRLLARYYKVM